MTITGSNPPSPAAGADDDEPPPHQPGDEQPPTGHAQPPPSTHDPAGVWGDRDTAPEAETTPFQSPTDGRRSTRQRFVPVRIQPVDLNGNKIAGWGRRIGAFAVDWGIVLAVEIVLLLLYGFAGMGMIGTWIVTGFAVAYFTITVGRPEGATPGMRLFGIAVVNEEKNQTLSYPQAFLRFLVMYFLITPVVPLLFVWIFAIYDGKRQALQDKCLGTVVIELACLPAPPPPAAAQAMTVANATAATAPAQPAGGRERRTPRRPTKPAAIDPLLRFVKKHAKRAVLVIAAIGITATIVTVAVRQVSQANAAAHSPARAATAYLNALSGKDVPALTRASGIVAPADVAPNVNVLLSASDIKAGLAQPGNSIGRVSDIVVLATHTTMSGTASVTLSYHADNDVHTATYRLISSDTSPSGWVVQVTPARLDVNVPTGDTAVTLDGMNLKLDGQVAHVYLYPSIATISVPASAIWQAVSATVDVTHQDPNADPQNVSFPDQLLPADQTSAIAAVTDQINACNAATSLTPPNCPNNDVPATTSQGDSYSGVSWTGLGQPTAGMTVSVDPKSGAVTVSGSETVEVAYTDTTPGTSFFGSVSNQQTDGPFNLTFSYPLTWSGMAWMLGTVTAKNSGSTAST